MQQSHYELQMDQIDETILSIVKKGSPINVGALYTKTFEELSQSVEGKEILVARGKLGFISKLLTFPEVCRAIRKLEEAGLVKREQVSVKPTFPKVNVVSGIPIPKLPIFGPGKLNETLEIILRRRNKIIDILYYSGQDCE